MSITRRRLIQAAALLPLAGCQLHGDSGALGSKSLPINLQLDWRFNAQFAGPLLADYRDYFRTQMLDVTIKPWSSGLLVTDEVASNPLTIGCAEQNLVLDAQAKGAPVRAVASMFQTSPLALMVLPDSGITSLADLAGKSVGVHIDGLKVMRLVQGVSGLSVDEIKVSQIPYEDKFKRLLSGEMAAIQCYAVDEPINFTASTGIAPLVLPLSEFGYEAYAQVLFAHVDFLENHPVAMESLLKAIFRGWTEALDDMTMAAKVIVERYAEPGSKYEDLAYQTASLLAVSEYVKGDLMPGKLGTIDPVRWQIMIERFSEYGIIPVPPALERSMTTAFWPA